MNIPAFLTGSAGRAIDDVMKVRGYASGASYTLHQVANGSTSAAHATSILDTIDNTIVRADLRAVVNGAKPGLQKALGSGQQHFSGTLHAKLSEIHSARSLLGTTGRSAEQAIESGRFGAASADALIGTIDDNLPALQSAARRTAAFRVTIGALGLGGAVAGANALRNAGDQGTPMAPGPINAPGAPDLHDGRVYA